MNKLIYLAAIILSLASGGVCAGQEQSSYAEAIRLVIEQDRKLGTVRNHASENAPIASAVEAYVSGLDNLDLEHCPPDFNQAMRSHRDAWHESKTYFEQFPDLRGEIHDVFDAIRVSSDAARIGLESVEAAIWDTWADVEAAMVVHMGPDKGGASNQ